ncbi:MAG: SpoIIE family protein phosphatase [Candidatus Latescibacteria bacterium]|nr:SpoIIE family protein phosphatase [Candidatus Latescibacterota bacterium]NIO78163.1 SpoIIE family protein phosphatase [Candidatus Latescibacterota bacterium]
MGITVASISYLLIIHEKKILKNEIERSVVLQGKNIALSSTKALLRPDPEFELYPLLSQLTNRSSDIVSVVITDANGIIQGDNTLQNIGTPHRLKIKGFQPVRSVHLGPGDKLYQNDQYYFFTTPVKSLDIPVGKVHLLYSKEEFHYSITRAITITLICALAALLLGIVFSLLLFQRISRPLDILMRGVREFGEGNLEAEIHIKAKNELRMLASSFNEMASKIAAAQRELVIKERMERELEIAREIQSTLLPKKIREPSGFEIGHYYQSAYEVGGDYMDVIPIDDDRTALVMADVSGKGVPGLVVMAMVKIMVQEFALKGLAPTEVIQRLNESLVNTTKQNMFVTLLFAIFDESNSELACSNAGHNPLLIYEHSIGTCRLVKMKGLPLGILADATFERQLTQYRAYLKPGDLILGYTDGLNESKNETGAQFTFERILRICKYYARDGAKALVSKLVEAEANFRKSSPQTDDITLLALSAEMKMPSRRISMEV